MEYRLHSRNPRGRQVKELKEEGYDASGEPFNEEDFNHISPASFEDINRLGKYNFKAVAAAVDEIKLEENGLRALRKLKSGFSFKKTNKITATAVVANRIFSANCYENLIFKKVHLRQRVKKYQYLILCV